MVKFPNAKINLGLHVLRKREDGYHDLETIFYPVALYDCLEFVPSAAASFQAYGKNIAGSASDNLILKAYDVLKQDYPSLPPLEIHLYKHIPMGAGLGGGSSDGAYMLMMLNKYFQLEISKTTLKNYALQLGSDCPFFIENIPCLAYGRGEELHPIDLDLRNYHLVLVKPSVHISTASAFKHIIPNDQRRSLKDCIGLPLEEWKFALTNDFEEALFSSYPELAHIKQSLYEQGAVYASLSGSGSTIYGLFEQPTPFKSKLDVEVYQIPSL